MVNTLLHNKRTPIRNILQKKKKKGHAVEQWLRYYATSRNVAGSRLDQVNHFLSIYLILPATLGPGVYSASNRNKSQKQINNISGKYLHCEPIV
jgi:hypothetical protein